MKLDDIALTRRPGSFNDGKVDTLTESIKNGASVDPIVLADFGEPKLRVADGNHRTASIEDAGKDAVPAFIGHHVPAQYLPLVTGTMQKDSTSVNAKEDLRKWRQKAIHAVKAGQPASVAFRSDAIDPSTVAIVTKALASARSVDDVWALFGGSNG